MKITPAPGQTNDLGHTDSEKTALVMQAVIRENVDTPAVEQVQAVVDMVMAKSGLDLPAALQWTASKLAYYTPDVEHQTVRTPARTLKERRANCVDYTVLICATALRMGASTGFELAAYQTPDFTHVYPLVNGVVVDCVPDQVQNGLEILLRRTNFLPKLGALERHNAVPFRTKFYHV